MSNKQSEPPQWSVGGLAAADVFYKGFNQYYFYVEDVCQENLYFEILKKVFEDVDITKIFPLGGKQNVLAHAKDMSNKHINNRVYLLDKDFDDLHGTKEEIDEVFYLNHFCIENYLMEPNALLEVVVESHPQINRNDIQSNLSLDTVIPSIAEELRPLFALFFLVQAEDLGIRNCSGKPETYCKPTCRWEISACSLKNYLNKVCVACDVKNIELPDTPLGSDPRLASFFASNDSERVSGKFWLAMMFHYLKSKYSLGTITFDSFVYRVAKNSKFTSLGDLAREVRLKYPV